MFKFKVFWADIIVTRQYIIAATIIFAISMYLGATNESFAHFLSAQLEGLGQLVDKIDESSNPTLSMIMLIFFNNAIKSVIVIFAGALFGLLPIFFLVINGMVIGFVLQFSANSSMEMSVLELIVKGLLPHGILEIPALLIASAYGLRLGKLLISVFGALLFDQNKLSQIGYQYKSLLQKCGIVSIYLVVALLFAAIIESTVTGWLLQL